MPGLDPGIHGFLFLEGGGAKKENAQKQSSRRKKPGSRRSRLLGSLRGELRVVDDGNPRGTSLLCELGFFLRALCVEALIFSCLAATKKKGTRGMPGSSPGMTEREG